MPQRLLIHGISCKAGDVEQGNVPVLWKSLKRAGIRFGLKFCKWSYDFILDQVITDDWKNCWKNNSGNTWQYINHINYSFRCLFRSLSGKDGAANI